MSIDFALSVRAIKWRARITGFINEAVIPAEKAAFTEGVDDELRKDLQAAAKAADVWAPAASAELGGGGFPFVEVAVLLEEAGRSLLGPIALNCAAPDEGNIHLLDRIASPAQRERYLIPLVRGDVRSCFAMSEPPPGAGSDPAALRTIATKVDGGWRLSGQKHLITGADGAAFCIVMAADGAGHGATMLLVDTDAPGFLVKEHIRTIDSSTIGGHCRVELDDVFVPDDSVLGDPGLGFRYAQVRLAPARLLIA